MNTDRTDRLSTPAQRRSRVPRAAVGWLLAGAACMCWCAAGVAQAADIQVHPECRARGAVVTLGDIATVAGADAQEASRLAAIELFPAPPTGRQRFVRLRELQDLLMLRGFGLAKHRFSGSSVAVVQGPGEVAPPVEPRPLSSAAIKRAERQVCESIVEYLKGQASGNEGWIVEVTLDSKAARALGNGASRISVRGGAPPWIGNQRFELTVETSDQPQSLLVDARVTRLGMVVATARSLGRGSLIRPEDVQLQRATPGEDPANCFYAVADVVGMEATRALPEGRVLDRDCLRPPLAVRRGEMITVYARGAGLRVRTTARAREDGSLGDLVAVESLLDRKAFTARVCGIQEAEVFARAVQAEPVANGPARVAGQPASETRREWK